MSKISAQIVADSICNGHRITTMKVTMPRIVLAEAKTHRVMKRTDEGLEVYEIPGIGFNDDEMLSRNSASSRAIPFNKMVESVMNDPFIPIAWQKDHKGMQGTEYFEDDDGMEMTASELNLMWLRARDNAVVEATLLNKAGASKQLCNRLLEPFMYHTVLVTATEWENFFHLRCPQYGGDHGLDQEVYFRSKKDALRYLQGKGVDISKLLRSTDLEWLQINKGQAEIHMMALAEAIWDQFQSSTPKELKPGEWHIPFGDSIIFGIMEQMENPIKVELGTGKTLEDNLQSKKIKIATAKAAQTSYTVVGEDGRETPYDKLIDLHDRLLASGHMSPFEHCAQAMTKEEYAGNVRGQLKTFVEADGDIGIHEKYVFMDQAESNLIDMHGWCHNLRGWKSYRSMIPNENRR
jgi:hypothetical protein